MPSVDKSLDIFLQNGLLGAIIVILLWAVYKLFSLYVSLQEKRISELNEWKITVDDNTKAIRDLTETERRRTDLLEQQQRLKERERVDRRRS